MRLSVELVPRDAAGLEEQLVQLRSTCPAIDTVNIPDILRFGLRSLKGCAQAKAHVTHAIPHIRAMDIDLDRPLGFAPLLERSGIGEVLVIAGDAPVDMSHRVYGASSIAVIRKLRRELPDVRVFAALDPYRQSLLGEHEYALEKLEAGATGLFSQPFFDLRLLEVYADLLPNVEVFWGVTSVTSDRSARYWRTRNRAVFPAGFEPTLAWSRRFASEVLEFARARGANLYFMPIRASVSEYLEGIL